MKKFEKMLRMAKYMAVKPGISTGDLAQLCDVSQRGIWRYISDMRELGIGIRCKNGGYALESPDLLSAIKLGAEAVEESDEPAAVASRPPFVASLVFVDVGLGSDADVRYAFAADGTFSETIRVDQLTSLEVNFVASGVKVKAREPDKGFTDLEVRWV